jgi:hypothetical protein
MSKSLIFFIVLLFYAKSFANAAAYSLGEPRFYGNGCNKNNTGFALSPDASVLSILFDEYKLEVDEESKSIYKNKNCIVVVPIKLPKGRKIGVSHLDYRGYVSLPDKASADIISTISLVAPHPFFRHHYNFLHTGLSRKSFRGPADEEFTLNTKSRNIFYSGCGGTAYLYLNSSMTVRSNRQKEYSLLTMDSLDVSHEEGTSLHLSTRPCR